MADEIKSLVDVYYGETLIGQVANGETGNVNCTGHEMTDDIRIKVPYDMKAIRLQTKSATINKNGQTVVFPDDGYVMSAAVLTVEVPSDNEWLGEFDADTEYRVGSIVSKNDMVYICIVKPTNNQPPTDTTYWELLSGKIQDEKIVDIITHGRLEFLPDEGYIAVRKFTANVAETPTFDGTVNIESGYTTISGSYVIDEQEAYDLLLTYGKVKTFNVNFGAGGPANGGDEIGFTSMTFDGTYGFIKYNDKAAFAMNGGFAEYNNNYGDGNGARVNFEEGTECRKEFKELFLSIADEYVEEEAEDELAGTWIWNEEVAVSGDSWNVNFTCNGVNYTSINSKMYSGMYAYYYDDTLAYDADNGAWKNTAYRTIIITSKLSEVENGDTLLAELLEYATKQGATSLISFTIAGTSYQAEDGMTWGEWVESEYNTDGFVFYAGSLCTSSLNYFVENSGGSSATITEGTNYSMSPYGGGN